MQVGVAPETGSEARSDVDRLTGFEDHIGLFLVAALAGAAAEALDLAFGDDGVHGLDLHTKDGLDGLLDLGFGRVHCHDESRRIRGFGREGRFLGDDGLLDQVVMFGLGDGAEILSARERIVSGEPLADGHNQSSVSYRVESDAFPIIACY